MTVLCFAPVLALAETNVTGTATNVLSHLRQISQHEGRYFLHVQRMLEATNGVPELIFDSYHK